MKQMLPSAHQTADSLLFPVPSALGLSGLGWRCLFCVSAVSLRHAPGVVEASGTECGVRVCALLVLRGAAGEILPVADTLWMCSCGLLSYSHLGGGLITLSVRL